MTPVPEPRRAYLTLEHPLRFAHRGSRVLWPENTMVGFQGVADLGIRYVETDVHATRDGRIVIFHDDRLERLTEGSGFVWDHDWEQLRRLDAARHFDAAGGYPLRGTGVAMPLLEEALATFPEINFNLDLKQEGIADVLAAEITRIGAVDRVLVGSFHDSRLRRFREASRDAVATSAGPREVVAALGAARLGLRAPGRAAALQVPERSGLLRVVTPHLVRSAHRAGMQVHVWTVNDPVRMEGLLELGVDGIISDRPDLLAEVVARRTE